MEVDVLQWLGYVLRVAHILPAMLWVGASFYLISWENKFYRGEELEPGIAGQFWTIQGGDFYRVEKIDGTPSPLPSPLHWFKWESYLTWISGFGLLVCLYYLRPELMLLRAGGVLESSLAAVAISLGSLVATWLIYQGFCSRPWARNLRVAAVVGVAAVFGLSWGYAQLFAPRAALVHTGAALATIMTANVFFIIIPWHRRLLRSARDGTPLEPLYATHPGFRSRHNHYMTLPVLVLMLVAHVPAITSARFAWAGGAMLAIAAGLAKHVHTRIQRGEGWAVCTLAAVLVLGLSMAISMAGAGPVAPCEGHASEEEITAIFERRCVACHHATGVRPDLSLGIAALEKHYWRVNQRVLAEHSMPPDNVTGMTQQERETLACGFGAPGSRRP